MANDNEDKADTLLKQARLMEQQLQRAGASANSSANENDNAIGQAIEEIKTLNKTMTKVQAVYTDVKTVAMAAYNTFLHPVFKVAGGGVRFLWLGYKWLLNKTDCKNYEEKWAGWKASKKFGAGLAAKSARALVKAARVIVLGTAIATGINLIPDSLGGEAIRYVTTEPAYDATKMAFFYHNKEKLYLNNASEIDYTRSLHAVTGCKELTHCDQESAVYFRVAPSLTHTLWNIVVNHSPFFNPGQVVAPITPGVNECLVTSYGARWRITRQLQAYPYMLNAECKPLTIKDPFNAGALGAQTQIQPPSAPAASTPAPR